MTRMRDPTPDDSELGLQDYLRILWDSKWVVFLGVVFGLAACLAVMSRQTPAYSASSDLLLQPRVTDTLLGVPNSDASQNAAFLETELQIIQSQAVRDAVTKQFGRLVLAEVTASLVGDSRVIRVTAASTDPTEAAAVANAYVSQDIEQRRQQVDGDLRAASAELKPKIDDLQKQIDDINATISRSPASQQVTVEATLGPRRDALVAQQSTVKQTYDAIQVQTELNNGGARVLRRAGIPSQSTKPRPRTTAVVAIILSVLFSVALVFVFEQLDDSVHTDADLRRLLGPDVPVLGAVPAVPGAIRGPTILSMSAPASIAAEAYRTLRTSVQVYGLDRPLRCIQVTSPVAGDGKTTTLANLAVVLAQAGMPLVAIDCDLRRPALHQFFDMRNDIGFTSVLLGDVSLRKALQPVRGEPNLAVLASGPLPNSPADMLASPRTAELVASLTARGLTVLIDCAPVLPVADAGIISSFADATLLVVSAGATRSKEIRRALDLLHQVDAPLAGVVLNRVSVQGRYGYGYGYAYYGREVNGRGRVAQDDRPADPYSGTRSAR